MRSFRAENVSRVCEGIAGLQEKQTAREVFRKLETRYPIVVTRNLMNAKNWVRRQSQRHGTIRTDCFV